MPKFVLTAADAVARSRTANLGFVAPLRPILIGPRAGLHRYAEAAERASLGAYDLLVDTTYDYPNRATGSVIDLTYTKLWAVDADLNYFNKYSGTNGSCQPSSAYPNRVRAANYTFKTANGYTRSADFYDRDVKVGDIVTVRGTYSGNPVTVTSTVTGFVGEPIAAVTAAATADGGNSATQIASSSISQTSGTPINDVVATAGGTYESSADGYITRTYTITVTQSSSGGDATTGRLRVRSADGGDDQDDVVPAAFSSATAIGTKGLTVTFAIDSAHSSSSLYGITEQDFVVGQQWVVTVAQAFTAPVATSAGTYTGAQSTNYVVTVSRGGTYAGVTPPQITVTSATGYDQSGPTSITAAATPFAVGNYGVTVSFNGTRLRKGDKYYITVTAAAEGAVKTLVLADDVPSTIRATEVDLRLFARRARVEIPDVRTTPTTATNWTADADGITVKAAISLIDSEFTNGAASVPIPVEAATLYVEYREWLTAGAGNKVVLSAVADIEAALGTVTPDNPIAYAASKALANTAGELAGDATRPAADTTDRVFCLALGGDPADADLWTTALDALENEDEAYAIVPLTSDTAVHALVAAHVAAQSTDAVGFYRVCWLPSSVDETAAVVSAATSSDLLAVTATIANDANSRPRVVTASSNANFLTNGVRAGDLLRINYGFDSFGDETYDEYTVASVTSQSTLVLSNGPAAVVSVAVRIEVWREYTKDELAAQLTAKAAGFASDRVRLVWPDTAGFGGTTLAGYNLCAALAGLSGSVPSQQGLRNVGVVGFDDLTRASRYFTNAQLKTMADGGVFVVTQTPDGRPYVGYANTTDPTVVGTREEMIVRNADMIRKAIQDEWGPYVGSGNVTSNIRQLLDGALVSLVNQLKSLGNVDQLGPPVANIQIASLAISATDATVLDVVLSVQGLAVPLNQIRLTLPVTV